MASKQRKKKPVKKSAKKAPAKKREPALARYRRRIDQIDDEILRLLTERAEQATAVGSAKEGTDSPIHIPERERQILDRLFKNNAGPLGDEAVEGIFKEIISACLSLERPLRIAFLGPETTFSHQAARKHFGKQPEFVPCETIEEVFGAVERGTVDYGVVPLENSIEGSVNPSLDRFMETSAKICAEVTVDVHHQFLRPLNAGKKCERIYSHPQVLGQCRRWILKHYPAAELVPTNSTAQAGQEVLSDRRGGALCSALTAELFGLEIAARNCEDRSGNRTRFAVIGRQETRPSGRDKTSLVLWVRDEPGVLSKILAPFAKSGVNLTEIISRPAGKRAWQYAFFVGLQGHIEDKKVAAAVKAIAPLCQEVKVLGAYPRAS